jgi:membrane protein
MADAPASDGAATNRKGRRGGVGWMKLAVNLYKEMSEDRIGLIAAGIAFYGLLAIFPGIVAVMAIAGLAFDPAGVVTQLEGLADVLPDEAAAIVIDQAVAVAGSEQGGLGLAAIFGLLIAFYSASNGISSMIQGLNVAFEVRETRGFVQFYGTVFALTLGTIVGFLLIVGLLAVLPAVLAFLNLGATGDLLLRLARWPLLLAILALGLALLYRYGPNRGPVPWHWITPGAIAACILWLIGTVAFTIYVANFGSYNETFGALGGVIILLTWLWLSAFIILMGAELDDEIERQDKAAGDAAEPVQAAKAVTPGSQ